MIEVEKVEVGYELNKLVADKVMDSLCRCEKGPTGWSIHGYGSAHGICHRCNRPHEAPNYSGEIAAAWLVVDALGKHTADFSCSDGYFILCYADSADHSQSENCKVPAGEESEDGEDLEQWSAHFHIGMPGSEHCPHTQWKMTGLFCARGKTPSLAICRAALKATLQADTGGGG